MEPFWIATGTSDTTELGESIAGIGDINQDGYDDFAVSTAEERVWIFLGSSLPDSIPDIYLSWDDPDTTLRWWGRYVTNIGDVNSDSYDDFAVFSRVTHDNWQKNKYFIYYSGAAFDTIPDLIVGPPLLFHGEDFIVGIGDFNGDGGNDFAIGDNLYVPGTTYNGIMQVFYGGAILDSLPDWQITAREDRDCYPRCCTGLGDLNGDGCDDFAAGSASVQGATGNIDNTGLVEVYYGGTPPDTIPEYRFYGNEEERFGYSLTGLDINRDGYLELCFRSAREYPPDYYDSYLIFDLANEPDSIPDYLICGTSQNKVGLNPTPIDFNGDGWDDLATGNALAIIGYGAAQVYLGGEDFNESLDLVMYGHYDFCYLGRGMANIGDFNGDGIEDLAVGEPGYFTFMQQAAWGRVHVILGDSAYHQSVGVEEIPQPPIPTSQILLESYPNPFNSQVVISFELRVASKIRLQIFDISGRDVGARRASPSPGYPPGSHQFTFNGEGLPSGIYIVRLQAGEYQGTKKIVLLK